MKLVPELHRDAVSGERKQLLAQTVSVLSLPLFCQERSDLCGTAQECFPVAPYAVGRVGKGYLVCITGAVHVSTCGMTEDTWCEILLPGVPEVLSGLDLGPSRLDSGEGWEDLCHGLRVRLQSSYLGIRLIRAEAGFMNSWLAL